MRKSGRVNIIHKVCCNIDSTLISKCGISAPNIVIDSFRQCNYIHSSIHKKLGTFLGAVAAHNYKAIKIKPVICCKHLWHKVVSVFVNNSFTCYIFLTGCPKNCSTLSNNTRKIFSLHKLVVAFYKAAITIIHSVDLYIVKVLKQCFSYTANCGIQALAVSTACNETNLYIALHN